MDPFLIDHQGNGWGQTFQEESIFTFRVVKVLCRCLGSCALLKLSFLGSCIVGVHRNTVGRCSSAACCQSESQMIIQVSSTILFSCKADDQKRVQTWSACRDLSSRFFLSFMSIIFTHSSFSIV